MAAVVTEKIIEMFLILLGGVIVYKAGLIDDKTVPKLSNLLLMFISPLLIFQSYQMEFEMRLFYGLLWTLAASAVTFAVTIVLSELLFRKKGKRTPVEKIAVIYSNSGFIGLPLINGIIGSEGIFYMTAYLTVFNLLLWTHGVLVMGSAGSFKEMCKNLLTPTIIAIFAGVVCFVTQLRLPEVLANPIQMIGNMNTPLAMIIAGANLAQGNLLKACRISGCICSAPSSSFYIRSWDLRHCGCCIWNFILHLPYLSAWHARQAHRRLCLRSVTEKTQNTLLKSLL